MKSRFLSCLLSLVLAFGLAPRFAFAADDVEAGGAAAPAFDASSGNYVEGEALVVYHAGSVPENALRSRSDEPSPLADAGFSLEESWDVSAADEAAPAPANAISPLSGDDAPASALEDSYEGEIGGSDVRVALVTKEGSTTAQLVEELSALDCVEAVQPNYVMEPTSLPSPDDPLYTGGLQQSLSGPSSESGAVDASIGYETALARDNASGSDNVVAVIDTGVDYLNPDLAAAMWHNPGNIGLPGDVGYDFGNRDDDPMPDDALDSSHGTHCAGIIAASSNNGAGIAGIAQHTKIMALEVSTQGGGSILLSAVAGAYDYLIKARLAGVNVVAANNSWAANGASFPVLDYLVNQAGKAGVLSVFGAGNDGKDVGDIVSLTSTLNSPYAVVVAATNEANALAAFSSYSATAVDVAAPGTHIVSTVKRGGAMEVFQPLYSNRCGGELVYYEGFETLPEGLTGVLYGYDDEQKTFVKLPDADQGRLTLAPSSTSSGTHALKASINAGALSKAYSIYRIDVAWPAVNPFKDLDPSDPSAYRCAVTPFIDMADGLGGGCAQIETYVSVKGGEGELAEHDSGSVATLDYRIANACPFSSLDTTGESLTMGFTIALVAPTGQPATVSGYCAGFGIGRADQAVPYADMQGTSMAGPAVTGAVAELAALYPSATPLDLRGRVVGGTEPLATEADRAKIASGGRFTFQAALDDASVSANTWSASCEGARVTVHGRGLADAELLFDGAPVALTAQSDSAVSFDVPETSLDGARHRFDVVDASTGRAHKAAYALPKAGATSLLERVGGLPEGIGGSGSLVAATDRLFYTSPLGDYLFVCDDPAADAPQWCRLADPVVPFRGPGSVARGGMIQYGYADGKLYGFCTELGGTDEARTLEVWCMSYDIASNAWAAPVLAGSFDAGSASDTFSQLFSSGFWNGRAYAAMYFLRNSGKPDQFADQRLWAFDPRSGAVDPVELDPSFPYAVVSLMGADRLYLLGLGATTQVELVAYDGSAFSEARAVEGLPFTNVLRTCVSAPVGNGAVLIDQTGHLAPSLTGDAFLLDASASRIDSLGTLFGDGSAGLIASSAAMLGGRLYVTAQDGEAATAREGGSDSYGALYRASQSVSDALGSTERTVSAAVASGGTAAVSDWRGTARSSLAMLRGDTATWTATPAPGHAFSGWYDAEGNLVSSASSYSAPVLSDTALEARFAKQPTSGGGGGAEPKELASTGDGLGALAAALAACAAVGLAAAVRTRRKGAARAER